MLLHFTSNEIWPRRWLQLAVLALALSGIFSIILVISRTPQLIALFPWMGELFSVSLVIHVDLSVLIWFLAMTGMFWSILLAQRPTHMRLPFAQSFGWGSVLIGTLLIALSPLSGEWEVIKSNYVPVIVNGLFFVGLALSVSGLFVTAMQAGLSKPKTSFELGIYLTLPMFVIALLCFIANGQMVAGLLSGLAFYENLFWAGGHVLQFVYMQLLLLSWLLLAHALEMSMPSRKFILAVVLIGPVITLTSFIPYLIYPVISQEHMDFFTWQMNLGLGIGGGLLALWLIAKLIGNSLVSDKFHAGSACKSALITSLILFAVGGAFGIAINGPNVRIPAHYHGSIVAVTLALMGVAYYLLPKLGGRPVAHLRMARLQPWLYGGGQLLHISGLAISGGYGVLRKAVGDTGSGGWEVKAALGVMGGGGLLAIIGGLLFVVVMMQGFRSSHVVVKQSH